MKGRVAAAIVFGVVGTAILVGLGTWQVQRLAWKEDIISRIGARLAAVPVLLPDTPDPEADRYLVVEVAGEVLPGEIHVLTSRKRLPGQTGGPGFRVIAPFETTDGRRIMIDRGYVPEAEKDAPRALGTIKLQGNLLWPDETDGFTPEPDEGRGIWFARDTEKMAAALGTEPLLVVVSTAGALDGAPEPMPVTVNIPNDHLEYAITWFSLAAVWVVMTVLLVRRERARAGSGKSRRG